MSPSVFSYLPKKVDIKEVSYMSPHRKIDHMVMEMEVMGAVEGDQGENIM